MLFVNWKLVWTCLTNPPILAISIANDEDICAGRAEEYHGTREGGVVPYLGRRLSSVLLRPRWVTHRGIIVRGTAKR